MQQIVSIKKEDRYLKIVIIEKKFFSYSLKTAYCICLDTDELNKIEEIKKETHKDAVWCFSLAAIDALQKKISFPDISWMKIKKLIPFQIESIFPLGTDGLIVRQLLKKEKKEKEVFFQAASEKLVQKRFQEILNIGIEPSYAAFDNTTYLKIIENGDFQNEGVYLHLNELETALIFFEKNRIKEQIFLDTGYSSLSQNLIQRSKLLVEIERILHFKKKENLPFILGGFFVFIEDIFDIFSNAKFISSDKRQTLHFLEIAQAKCYNSLISTMINLSSFGLPKQIQKEQQQTNHLKKIFWAVITCFFIVITALNFSVESKIKQLMESYNEKKIENYQANIPIILDIKKHPVSIISILNTVEETVSKNSAKLTSCGYKLEKYPQFKSPSIPFLVKVNVSLEGTDKNTQTIIKDLKKLPSFDLKKGIKLEKKHDRQNLEFYIKQIL